MPWRSVVAAAAHHAKVKLNEGDVEVAIVAKWVRPASHLKKNGEVRSACDSAPGYADCDKIARAICDALAGIAYRNDRQVAKLSVERKWCIVGEAAGAFISVTKLQVSSPEALRPAQE